MGSPAFDNSVTDLESFCAQLSTAIGALNTAQPDLQADAKGYDTLLPALRHEYDAAESAATALDGAVEPAGTRVAEALEKLADDAGSWEDTAQSIGEAATSLAADAGHELAEHARRIEEGWHELWSGDWTALKASLEQITADLGRWSDEGALAFETVERATLEASEAVEHERDETLALLTHAAESTHDADVGLDGLHLHAPSAESEIESAFAERATSVESLLAEWGHFLEGEATVTRSAVETLAADGQAALDASRARLAQALEALAAELERVDLELGQTTADAAGGRDRAEQAAALEPDLERTEARVAQIRALMASFEPS